MGRNIFQDTPPYQVGIIQSRATRNIAEFRANILQNYNLTTPEWFVLGYVANETGRGGTKVGDIASVLDVQSTYVTGMLRKLESKDLMQTRMDKQDRRARIVTATDKGLDLAKKIEAEFVQHCSEWLDEVPAKSFQQFVKVLEQLS